MSKDKIIQSITQRYSKKISKDKFLNLCSEIMQILDKILENKYAFKIIQDARSALESPEDLIVPWDEIDQKSQEETLNLLEGAKGDTLRLYDFGLNDLLQSYNDYRNLDEFLGPIIDRDYTDLYTLAEWGA